MIMTGVVQQIEQQTGKTTHTYVTIGNIRYVTCCDMKKRNWEITDEVTFEMIDSYGVLRAENINKVEKKDEKEV